MQSVRHVTILFSEIADFPTLTNRLGDQEAAALVHRIRTLHEIVITRDDLGQILQAGESDLFAVFDTASVALNRALELQRLFSAILGSSSDSPGIRIGLHMGELIVRNGDQLEVVGRHLNRARRVAESAAPGQIFASESVTEAARDHLDLPPDALRIENYGEYHLHGAGPTQLCEVADLRFGAPVPPRIEANEESSLFSRMELAGFSSLKRIGEGSLGVVYRATEINSGKEVAIKVLGQNLSRNPQLRDQLLREDDRLKRIQLPDTLHPSEQHLEHQPPFQVMERVFAKPVDVALAEADSTTTAVVFQNICRILETAHQQKVLHGNLKPGNVLVREDGTVLLLDFTSRYLHQTDPADPGGFAPELIRGGEPTAQTDIYALGMLLFQALTGTELFARDSLHDVIVAHLHQDPPLPGMLQRKVADGIQRICLKALEKHPADRYPTLGAMRKDLDRFVNGDAIHTRPTTYDNLLYHRVQRQVNEVNDWSRDGLLTDEESDRLISSYEGLQRRGVPALMEARLFRFWQTTVYLGGWAVVNGALLWLMQQWDTLARPEKLILGSVPAVTSLTLGLVMWRMERFRLAFVALLVGILAIPVCAGVWFHEFDVAATVSDYSYELLHEEPGSGQLTNLQLTAIALSTFLVAALVTGWTRTTTHSAQTLLALAALYTFCLLLLGLKLKFTGDHIEWANVGLHFVPLLLISSGIVQALLTSNGRQHQAAPWIYFASALAIALAYILPRYGLRDWLQTPEPILSAASWLFTSLVGVLLVLLGILARNHLRHRCRSATLGVIVAGLLYVLAGLAMAGSENWPEHWWSPTLFDASVPAVHLALPIASLAITLFACRYQMVAFLLVGLAGFTASIHFLGQSYFGESAGWPKLVMTTGTAAFFAALYLELRRTQGNTIDDVVRTTRL